MGKKLVFNFTLDFVKNISLPPPGKRAVYYDTQQKNLSLIVTHKGGKSYYVQRTIHGITTRFCLGRVGELSIKEAREMAYLYAREIAQGKSKREILNKPKKDITLNAYFARYIERYAKQHKVSWKYEESNYKVHVENSILGRKFLAKVVFDDIQNLHIELGKTRGKIISNRVIAMLAVMFNQAIAEGYYIGDNPTKGIAKFREFSRKRYLTGDEFPAFLQALENTKDKTICDYILLSLLTGARKSNVLAMRWDHIDFTNAEWHIPKTKNGEAHSVPLVDVAVEILKRRKTQDYGAYVFPPQKSNSKTPHMVEIKRGWEAVLVDAGFKDVEGKWLREKITPHDLRRTCGSWQARMGSSLFIIGQALGHNSPKSTTIYARVNSDPVRESLNKASEAMLALSKKAENKSGK